MLPFGQLSKSAYATGRTDMTCNDRGSDLDT